MTTIPNNPGGNAPINNSNVEDDPLLQSPVHKKDYESNNQNAGGTPIVPAPAFTFDNGGDDFDEEDYNSPSDGKKKKTNEQPSGAGNSQGGVSPGSTNSRVKKDHEPFNPDVNDMKDSEKTMSAAQMAKMAIGVYEYLHQFPNSWSQISDKKIHKLERQGKVDMMIAVKWEGQFVPIKDLIGGYNNSVNGIFEVSDEFKKEVTPVLTRLLKKSGVGMSDENYLLYLFGQDIASKLIIGYKVWQGKNEIVNALVTATEEARALSGRGTVTNGVSMGDHRVTPTPPPASNDNQTPPSPVKPSGPINSAVNSNPGVDISDSGGWTPFEEDEEDFEHTASTNDGNTSGRVVVLQSDTNKSGKPGSSSTKSTGIKKQTAGEAKNRNDIKDKTESIND